MLVGDVELSNKVIAAAMAVHSELGPGLLESMYQECFVRELEANGLRVRREVPVPVRYRGVLLQREYRIDLLVENRLIVEVKAIERMTELHRSQLRTYLRVSGIPVGLLLNFNVQRLRDGIQRAVAGDW